MMVPGYILIRKNIISSTALKDFSQVIIKVFYPCLIFSSITKNYSLQQIFHSWQLPVAVFLILIIGYLTGLAYNGFFSNKSTERKKSILLQLTINNYSFLPLAIIAKLYDEQHMAALILSTLGAEITVWTLGIAILTNQKGSYSTKNLKHLLAAPLISIYFSFILLAIFAAFHTSMEEISAHNNIFSYLRKSILQLGDATIPLSMIMIGGRMGQIKFGDLIYKDIWSVTLLRLIVIPVISIFLVKTLFPLHPFLNVMIIVAAMPCSINSLVLGELYSADQKLLSGTVLITHMVALITIPLWLLIAI